MTRADVYLLYGDTGVGKTAQLGEIAQWEFSRTGGVTCLISSDSGWDPIEHLIISPDNPGGCVEAWNNQFILNPFPTMIALSEGAWPEISGNRLVLAKRKVNEQGQMLTADGRPITQYFIEGLSTLSDALLQDHIRNGRKIAQEPVGTFTDIVIERDLMGKETSHTISFAKAAPAHFGQVQDVVLLDMVPRFGKLPVTRVIWTAHEAKGHDDITGIQNSVLGPATVGKAAVNRTARKFGEYFHLTVEHKLLTDPTTKAVKMLRDYRAYFVPHPDDILTKCFWPAKVSLPLSRSEELFAKFPGGYIPLSTTTGITSYLEFKESWGKKGQET